MERKHNVVPSDNWCDGARAGTGFTEVMTHNGRVFKKCTCRFKSKRSNETERKSVTQSSGLTALPCHRKAFSEVAGYNACIEKGKDANCALGEWVSIPDVHRTYFVTAHSNEQE